MDFGVIDVYRLLSFSGPLERAVVEKHFRISVLLGSDHVLLGQELHW